MSDPVPLLNAPAWITKRDGRLVPFEADKISRALFAATEELGHPDAFLARELTDGVVHFLAVDLEEHTPSTTQVAELVAKVVRELGQPVLALAFQQGESSKTGRRSSARATEQKKVTPAWRDALQRGLEQGEKPVRLARQVGGAGLREFSLQEVFARDLVAAHQEGLLQLTGLESPFELAGCVLGSPLPAGSGMVEAIESAREFSGDVVALDSPELAWVESGVANHRMLEDLVRELAIGVRVTGLRAVVNVNIATPPAWADERAEGPLFAGQRPPLDPLRKREAAHALVDAIRADGTLRSQCRVDWHLTEPDFQEHTNLLLPLARWALEGGAVAFVLDRPRRPVALAEGLTRKHPAALLQVGLNLPHLLRQMAPKPIEPASFLQKLGSLARLARSAAVQKRDFLRKHADRVGLNRGFLLDRARLVVAPFGLDALTRTLFGRGPCGGGEPFEFTRQVVQRLRDVLRDEGRACLLDICLDGTAAFKDGIEAENVAGLTTWDDHATVKQQLRTSGTLHGLAEMGTAALRIPAESPPTPETVVDWLRWAWLQTDLVRVVLRCSQVPARQPLLAAL